MRLPFKRKNAYFEFNWNICISQPYKKYFNSCKKFNLAKDQKIYLKNCNKILKVVNEPFLI